RDKCGPRLDAVPTWSDAAALPDDACAPNTHNAVQHFVSGRDQLRPLQEADHHRRIAVYRRSRCALRPLDGGGAIQIPLIRVRSMRCDFRLWPEAADLSVAANRVESRMGAVLEALPIARFPSPLIEPDVPISGIRLSDWIHRMASGIESHASVAYGRGPICLSLAIELPLKDPDLFWCCQAHRQSPD